MASKNDTNMDSAVTRARAAWLCNATVADGNWALRQLHGLSRLLLENRDEIVARLVHDSDSKHGAAVWERELAVIQLDLVAHIKSVSGSASVTPLRADKSKTATLSKKSSSDSVSTSTLPRGVSLVVSNCRNGRDGKNGNPLRYAIASLAASIAARNAVVLDLPDDRDDGSFLQLFTHRKKDTLPDNVAELRSKYETAIPVLEPEHPGCRIDFFVQVEHAVKSAAALIAEGGLAAAYYGFRY